MCTSSAQAGAHTDTPSMKCCCCRLPPPTSLLLLPLLLVLLLLLLLVVCRLVFAVGSHRDFALPFWHNLEGRDLGDRGYPIQSTGDLQKSKANLL